MVVELGVSWFSFWWVLPRSILDLYKAWWVPLKSIRGKVMWRASFVAVMWIIWKERNARCFENSALAVDALVDNLKFSMASWMVANPHFYGYAIDQIILNW